MQQVRQVGGRERSGGVVGVEQRARRFDRRVHRVVEVVQQGLELDVIMVQGGGGARLLGIQQRKDVTFFVTAAGLQQSVQV